MSQFSGQNNETSSAYQMLRKHSNGQEEESHQHPPHPSQGQPKAQPKSVASKKKSAKSRKTNHGHVSHTTDSEDDNNEDVDESDTRKVPNIGDDSIGEGGRPIKSRGGHKISNLPSEQNASGESNTFAGLSIPPPAATESDGNKSNNFASRSMATASTPGMKRTLSSTLDDNEATCKSVDETNFPRKRIDRKLSSSRGMLKYDPIEAAALRALAAEAKAAEDALLSEDDDEIYKKVDEVPDDSDAEDFMGNSDDEVLAMSDAELETAAPSEACEGSGTDVEPDDPFNEFRLSAKIDTFFGTGGFLADVDAYDGNTFVPTFLSEMSTPRRKSESSERRVRFQDEVVKMQSSSSSSSSSEFDFDTFPDLLDALDRDPIVPQESLDHLLLHHIEGADDDFDLFGAYEGSDAASSEYDFGENEAAMHVFKRTAKGGKGPERSSDSDSGSLSGYDSDGDTTDDDVPPPPTVSRPKTILHSPTRPPQAMSSTRPFPRNKRAQRRGPVLGSFQAVEGKPFAYYDATAKRLRIVNTPRCTTRPINSVASSASNSPHVNFNGIEYESDSTIAPLTSSLFPGNLDVMMSGVFGGPPGQRFHNGRFVSNTGDLYGGSFGAPEAFFAKRLDSLSEEGSDYTTETNSSAAQIDVLSDFLNIEQIGHSPSADNTDADEQAVQDSSALATEDETDAPGFTTAVDDNSASVPNTPLVGNQQRKSPRQTKHSRNLSSSMLAHFDRGVVGSFRNNQDRYRMLSRLPHGDSDAKPIKAGKSAMDVMTPPRRRRGRRTILR